MLVTLIDSQIGRIRDPMSFASLHDAENPLAQDQVFIDCGFLILGENFEVRLIRVYGKSGCSKSGFYCLLKCFSYGSSHI